MKFGTVNPSHVEIRDRKEQHVYDAIFIESHYELNFTEFGEELLLSIIGYDNWLWKRYWQFSWWETSCLGRKGHDKDFDDIISRNNLSTIKIKCALHGVSYNTCRRFVLRTILMIDDEKEWKDCIKWRIKCDQEYEKDRET